MKLFVYGTLLSYSHTMKNLLGPLAEDISLVCDDTIKGGIFSNGWYPCLKTDIDGVVQGEVYEFEDESILHILDRYEGVHGTNDGLYRRLMVTTLDEEHEVWVYEFCGSVSHMNPVPDNDWHTYKVGPRNKEDEQVCST